MKKSIIIILIIIVCLIVLDWFVAAPGNWIVTKYLHSFGIKTKPVACTMEAKICADGSSVGRQLPNCDFAPCPVVNIPGWSTYTNQQPNFTFQYPPQFPAEFIRPVAWPPAVNLSDSDFTCTPQAGTSSLPERITQPIINNHVYCLSATSEGAAGSVFTDYIYTTLENTKLITATFTLQYPQCLNYDNPNQTNCLQERETFNLDALVDKIISTIKY